MEKRIVETVISEREATEKGVRITIFANALARDEVELILEGMELANYLKNPVVLWAHDSTGHTEAAGLPIGRTTRLEKTDGKLTADFEFLPDDPFASRVKNAWDKGFINAASVSWMPIETEDTHSKDEGAKWRDVKSELLEWSLVAVPADPDALRDVALRRLRLGALEERENPPFNKDEMKAYIAEQVAAEVATKVAEAVREEEPVVDVGLAEAVGLVTEIRKGLKGD